MHFTEPLALIHLNLNEGLKTINVKQDGSRLKAQKSGNLSGLFSENESKNELKHSQGTFPFRTQKTFQKFE